MKLPALYKKSSTGKTSFWEIEVVENKFRTLSGFLDGEKVLSAFTECGGKSLGASNETSPEEQALKEAQSLWKKRLEKGSYENIKDIGKKKFFEPMLAKDYNDYIPELNYPLYSDPKYDGVRCVIVKDGMFSRNGKQILSAIHIFEDLQPLFKKNPDYIFDGELFCEKNKADFNKIISLVRKTKPTKEDLVESKKFIEYRIYDLPSNKGTFLIRKQELNNLILPLSCKVVITTKIKDEKQLTELYSKYLEEGYEGQMIRLDEKYQNKRSKHLLKRKEFKDEEFVIKGVIEGKGNLQNKIGKLEFETKDGIKFEAPINASWEELEEMWKNKDQLIGKIATVKYFEKTTDGSLRFPKCLGIRDYE